jgi:glutamine amidotransferase
MAIAVLNYGLGNLRSVSNALRMVGADPVVSSDAAVIESADALVIPGVGSFPHGMTRLSKSGLIPVITDFVASSRPVLGICLGMQLLFERGSEFEWTAGLGFLPGTVELLPITRSEGRLPHIAWSDVTPAESTRHGMFSGLSDDELRFYFVHSYGATGIHPDDLGGTAQYLGHDIVAAVQHGNVWGTQFHPEKSGPSGLQLLRNFLSRTDGRHS